MPSLCITLTSPFGLNAFLLGHVARIIRGMRVAVCVNQKESDISIALPPGADLLHVEIRRAISPLHDLLALLKLWQLYTKQRFSVVFTITPKGGLLGMMAAFLARTPVRIHFFTGQVWANKRGLSRSILKAFDRLISGCATHLLADSPSQRDFLVAEGVVGADRIRVLGDGSISGVNAEKFRPDPEARKRIRSELGINPESCCLIYVGRMKREKGVPDLLEAFEALRGDFFNLEMILVGPDEENLLENINIPALHVVGYTKNVEHYMAAADIFCLPSYREGFGSVLIEAAAAGLPSVASKIYGITDAVVDGETGLLHSPGDVNDIKKCLADLLGDPRKRAKMGSAGRHRAEEKFSTDRVEKLFFDFLRDCMRETLSGAAGA